MKRLLTLLLITWMVMPGKAKDIIYQYEVLSYTDMTIKLTVCMDYGSEYSPLRVFDLPATYYDYKIVELGYNCLGGYAYRINIPEGVTTIAEQMGAFNTIVSSFPSTLTTYTGSGGHNKIIFLNGAPLDFKNWASRETLYFVAPGTRDGWVASFAATDPQWGQDWNIVEQGAMPTGENYQNFLNKAWGYNLSSEIATAEEQLTTLDNKYGAYLAVYQSVKPLYDEVQALYSELDNWSYDDYIVTNEQKEDFDDRLFSIYLTIPYVGNYYADDYTFVKTYWPKYLDSYNELCNAAWPATTEDFAERYLDIHIHAKTMRSTISKIDNLSNYMTPDDLEENRIKLLKNKEDLLAIKAEMEGLPAKPTVTINFPVSFNLFGNDLIYSTYSASFQTELPDGISAFVVTGYTNGQLQFEFAGTRVPANTGVLLQGVSMLPGNYIAKTADELGYAWENPATNLFVAHPEAGNIDVTGRKLYGLYNNNGNPEFRRLTSNGIAPANKAYLDLTDVSNAPSIIPLSFNSTTGISTLATSPSSTSKAIYNLNGQRVNRPTKGLYIINGKKITIK